ncbi:MAG TPA: DUF3592 domain-containing protein [Anaerolineae bacterium]|nr:DUF3592 domain-containing protein [Anaerolineae bacterium]
MLSGRITPLAPPPRRVPWAVVCSAMLGTLGVVGAGIFVFSMPFVLIFAGELHLIDEIRLSNSGTTAVARVTAVEDTNSTENDVPVYAYRFEFRTRAEELVTARSFATGRRYSVEDRATVYYLPDKPGVARLENTRRSEFPAFAGLMVLIFPLTGLALFAIGALRGWRDVTLLRHGQVAGARWLRSQMTNMSVNNQPVLKYTYEFQAEDGQTYTGSRRALPSPHVGDEAHEPVLYLPSHPARSLPLDALSLRYPVRVDDSGQWSNVHSPWSIVWCSLAYTLVFAGILFILTHVIG